MMLISLFFVRLEFDLVFARYAFPLKHDQQESLWFKSKSWRWHFVIIDRKLLLPQTLHSKAVYWRSGFAR